MSTMSAFSARRTRMLRSAALPLALALALGQVAPAFATIDNTVTANGTPTAGTLTPATANESVDVIDKTTGVNLVKSVTAPTVLGGANATFTDAGDTVTYTYTITNTGNVSLGAVAITDPGPTFDGNPLGGTWVAPTLTSGDTDSDNRIDPTETWVYNTTYTLVQGDVDNALGVTNGVSNTASVATQDPDAVPVTTPGVCPTCTAETTITGTPTLAVTKVATYDLGAGVVTADGTTDNVPVGTVITYTYTITNTGPVTIDNVTLADAHLGTGTVPVPDPDGATLTDNLPAGGSSNTPSGDNDYDVLAPGDMLTVTATYTVDQGDIDAQ